jgi:hypothetical protein
LLRKRGALGDVPFRNFAYQRKLKESFGIDASHTMSADARSGKRLRLGLTIVRAFAFVGSIKFGTSLELRHVRRLVELEGGGNWSRPVSSDPDRRDLRAVLRGISRALYSSRSVAAEEPLPEKLAALARLFQRPSNDNDRHQRDENRDSPKGDEDPSRLK